MLAAIVALALAAAACSGDDSTPAAEDDGAATTAAETTTDAPTTSPATTSEGTTGAASGDTAPGEWVGAVCGALVAWQDEVRAGAADLAQSAEPAEAKQIVTDYLSDVVASTEAMISEVRAAGAPAIAQGQEIAADFVAGLSSVRDAFERARDDVGDLSTSDPAALASGLQEVATTLRQAGTDAANAFASLGSKYPDAGLAEAAAGQPECAALAG